MGDHAHEPLADSDAAALQALRLGSRLEWRPGWIVAGDAMTIDQPDLFGRASTGLQEIVAANAGQFRAGFPDWLDENQHVWARFAQEVGKIRAMGRARYSARTIIEVLRHESALADTDATFKLNDHNTPDLARLYLLTHPDAAGFFETRVLSTSERTA